MITRQSIQAYLKRLIGEPWCQEEGRTCGEIICRLYRDCLNIHLPRIGLYPSHLIKPVATRRGKSPFMPLVNLECWQPTPRPEFLSVAVFNTGPNIRSHLQAVIHPVIPANARPHVALCVSDRFELTMFHKDRKGARFEAMPIIVQAGYREPVWYRHKSLNLNI